MALVPVILIAINIFYNFDNVSGFSFHNQGDSNSFETTWTEFDNVLCPHNKELNVEEDSFKRFKVTFPKYS